MNKIRTVVTQRNGKQVSRQVSFLKQLVFTGLLACASLSQAATVSLSSLLANPANSITSSGLVFDQFTAAVLTGSDVSVDFSNINVSDLADDGVHGNGLRFDILNNMLDLQTGGQTALFSIGYRVTATTALTSAFAGYVDQVDVSSGLNGFASVDETVQFNASSLNNFIRNDQNIFFDQASIPTAPPVLVATASTDVTVESGSVFATLNGFDHRYNVAPVPLPAGVWLFISGLAVLFGFRRSQPV